MDTLCETIWYYHATAWLLGHRVIPAFISQVTGPVWFRKVLGRRWDCVEDFVLEITPLGFCWFMFDWPIYKGVIRQLLPGLYCGLWPWPFISDPLIGWLTISLFLRIVEKQVWKIVFTTSDHGFDPLIAHLQHATDFLYVGKCYNKPRNNWLSFVVRLEAMPL